MLEVDGRWWPTGRCPVSSGYFLCLPTQLMENFELPMMSKAGAVAGPDGVRLSSSAEEEGPAVVDHLIAYRRVNAYLVNAKPRDSVFRPVGLLIQDPFSRRRKDQTP